MVLKRPLLTADMWIVEFMKGDKNTYTKIQKQEIQNTEIQIYKNTKGLNGFGMAADH